MLPRYRHRIWLFVLGFLGIAATDASAQLWRQFLPSAGTGADKLHTAGKPAVADLSLTQENGPWMIVAASFSGEGAQEQAKALAQEFRTRYRLTAYLHEMSFKLGEGRPGQGLDEYGAPVRRRFRRGDEVRELAVLVGDFTSIDDPDAQETLDRIKTLRPDALNVDADETAQSMAQVRRFEDALLEKLGKPRKRGPMAQAFLTRNPLLPREYFVPKGVDPFVAKMNDGVKHSLLDCAGKYTIKVATFRGKTTLQTSAKEDTSAKSFWGARRAADDNPLVEAAENAHLLTEELRAAGWEAFEFHDRTESIVTIGSLAEVAQRLPDGRILAVPAAERIFRTFGAAYDTPADPLTGIGNDEATQRRVDQEEQQFNMRLSQQGQIVPGLNPKHVKIFTGSGKRRKLERIIPMDPTPQVIEVPRRSISSAYAG
jgi:hypothetical protein